jgi:hypothetical protein
MVLRGIFRVPDWNGAEGAAECSAVSGWTRSESVMNDGPSQLAFVDCIQHEGG